MPRPKPSGSTHRDSGKQKGSSKTVKSIMREALINHLTVGVELGPDGAGRFVNHKARGRRGQPREDTASLASDRSTESRGATRSVDSDNESVRSVLPDNVHPHNVPQASDGGQPGGDTASVASGKSNKSTKSKHSVHSDKSEKSTKTEHSANNGNGSIRSVHPESLHQDSSAGGNDGIDGQGEEEGHGGEEDHGIEGQKGERQDGGEGDGANDIRGKDDVGAGDAGQSAGGNDYGGNGDAGEGEGVDDAGHDHGDSEKNTCNVMVIRERK